MKGLSPLTRPGSARSPSPRWGEGMTTASARVDKLPSPWQGEGEGFPPLGMRVSEADVQIASYPQTCPPLSHNGERDRMRGGIVALCLRRLESRSD